MLLWLAHYQLVYGDWWWVSAELFCLRSCMILCHQTQPRQTCWRWLRPSPMQRMMVIVHLLQPRKVCVLLSWDDNLLLGHQEEHPACKNWVMGCWSGYLFWARCRLWNDLSPGLRRLGLTFDSFSLWKLIYLATEALSDSFEFIGAVEISLSVYVSIYGPADATAPSSLDSFKFRLVLPFWYLRTQDVLQKRGH